LSIHSLRRAAPGERRAGNVLACLIALWVFIEPYFLRGTHGENRFAPDPLA
jgi:uncharacterized membrane protein YhaH (DUF805 family)